MAASCLLEYGLDVCVVCCEWCGSWRKTKETTALLYAPWQYALGWCPSAVREWQHLQDLRP